MSVPAVFDYHPVQSLDEAIALLQQYGDEAKVLAGGHSLIPAMKLRLSQPGHLIDIGRIGSLSYVKADGDAVAIGALTTYAALTRSDLLRQNFPLLTDAASTLGDQQVRNRGTIGGSLAHSDPAGDMPGVVLALRATIVVQGPNGSRKIAADDFFVGTFETALAPDEILTEIRLPLPPTHTGSAYIKLENKASHYAITGSAAVLSLDNSGVCTAASLTITGASTQTIRATATEAALLGKKLDSAVVADAASHAADGMEAVADIHGSAEYRTQMTNVIAQRTLLKALERAQA
jgi:aerobic carbon-monoxide dehydrogenase medium subunit